MDGGWTLAAYYKRYAIVHLCRYPMRYNRAHTIILYRGNLVLYLLYRTAGFSVWWISSVIFCQLYESVGYSVFLHIVIDCLVFPLSFHQLIWITFYYCLQEQSYESFHVYHQYLFNTKLNESNIYYQNSALHQRTRVQVIFFLHSVFCLVPTLHVIMWTQKQLNPRRKASVRPQVSLQQSLF